MTAKAYIQQTQIIHVKQIYIMKNKFKSTTPSCNGNRRSQFHASLTVTGRIFLLIKPTCHDFNDKQPFGKFYGPSFIGVATSYLQSTKKYIENIRYGA